MNRVAPKAGFRTIAAGTAMLAALLVSAAPAAAQLAHVTPRIPYTAYPTDDRLSFGGVAVRPAIEAARELVYEREMARVRATQPYDPSPAIWRIGDADTTIYLFGTIHSLPIGFRWRNAGLEAVLARADSLLLESTSEDATALDMLTDPVDGGTARPPLIDRVAPAFRKQLAEFLQLLPQEAVEQLDRTPTWIAALAVTAVRSTWAGEIAGEGADEWLERYFLGRGKPVEAIEDSVAVLASISAVPESAQRQMLEEALTAPEPERTAADRPAHAWARGEVGPNSPLVILPEQLDPAAALADPMLDRRNLAWTKDLIMRLARQRGTILFAAGAGHFVGNGSVLDLLRARGIQVERVQ